MNTRAIAADTNIDETTATVITRLGPDGRQAGQVVTAEIDGTILVRAKDPVEIRRQARLEAIGDEIESMLSPDQWARVTLLLGEADQEWANRVQDVHDYVLRHVGYALEEHGMMPLWRLLYAHMGSDDDKYRPNACMEFLHAPADCESVIEFQERGGHW